MSPDQLSGPPSRESSARCPICGIGVVGDVAFDATNDAEDAKQRSDSRELVTYSCGHEVVGGSLASADGNRLAVERRATDDTVMPIENDSNEHDSEPTVDDPTDEGRSSST